MELNLNKKQNISVKIIYCESEKQIIKINLRKDDMMKIFKIKKNS